MKYTRKQAREMTDKIINGIYPAHYVFSTLLNGEQVDVKIIHGAKESLDKLIAWVRKTEKSSE